MKQIAGDPGLPGTATSREGKKGSKPQTPAKPLHCPDTRGRPGLTSEQRAYDKPRQPWKGRELQRSPWHVASVAHLTILSLGMGLFLQRSHSKFRAVSKLELRSASSTPNPGNSTNRKENRGEN